MQWADHTSLHLLTPRRSLQILSVETFATLSHLSLPRKQIQIMSVPVATNIVWHEGVSQEQRAELAGQKGVTVWFTGLSGAAHLFYILSLHGNRVICT